MAKNIKANCFLVNLDWKKIIYENMDEEEDRELAKERLLYLFESMESILLHDGKQIKSGNMEIDYPVKTLINQIKVMRGENKDTDINEDYEIAKMKLLENLKSSVIAEKLSIIRGKKIGDSGIRSKEGWINPEKFLSKEEIELVKNKDNDCQNVDSDNEKLTKWNF